MHYAYAYRVPSVADLGGEWGDASPPHQPKSKVLAEKSASVSNNSFCVYTVQNVHIFATLCFNFA